ncbi:DUF4350 domain-containing protein [Agromyces aurantiacus]|uniref:DUF4350 domain-containing protein n=1 Tax=Agromyces aurantiacus TaxID=165814 RepID=A0ABV9R7P0_9MICO|nr:DUF4350 domain-containing protein [Agromyces aurantiacus]MBM7504198.1 hypothetical protein [Agromyces aurantiacus]
MTAAPPAERVERRPADGGADAPVANRSLTPGVRALVRRRRAWIVIALALVLGGLVLALIQGLVRPPGVALGADNPAPGGAQALVRVLSAQGVEVRSVRTLAEAERAAARGATVFLYDEAGLLDRERVAGLAAAADLLVVARPDFAALEVLAPGVRLAGAAGGPIDRAACELPAARSAGSLSEGQALLTVDDDAAASGFAGCFAEGDAFAVVSGPSPDGAEVALVASEAVFANETIDEAGNAALAIGLLGARDELAWYLPGPADVDASGAPTLAELTPGWVSPVAVLLGLAVVAAGVWRGRRFGPLVVEDLPVHVPAAETGEGRARLYARSSARLRALDQLRMGAIRRLTELLRLPRSAHVDAVVAGIADATGRPAPSVRAVLVDALPAGDRELVGLARDLDDLERAVRDALRPSPTEPDPTGRRP